MSTERFDVPMEEWHQRISSLENNAVETKMRLGEMDRRLIDQATILGTHGSKMDQIFQVVNTLGAKPQFDFGRVISYVRDIVAITMMIATPMAGVIVWMIITITAANDRVQQLEVEHLKETQAQMIKDLHEKSWPAKVESSKQ